MLASVFRFYLVLLIAQETLDMTRKAPGQGGGGGGSGPSSGSGSTGARPSSLHRVSLKGLEGGKLAEAVRHAAATAEARHLCFDNVRHPDCYGHFRSGRGSDLVGYSVAAPPQNLFLFSVQVEIIN